jgi:hypothetical protein
MKTYNIAVIGLGKISQDQHLPVIAKSRAFELAAVSSQRGLTAGSALPFRSHEDLLARTPDLDAVASHAGCSPAEVIERHAARTYRECGTGMLWHRERLRTLADSDITAKNNLARAIQNIVVPNAALPLSQGGFRSIQDFLVISSRYTSGGFWILVVMTISFPVIPAAASCAYNTAVRFE